jgi:hypothetical protein
MKLKSIIVKHPYQFIWFLLSLSLLITSILFYNENINLQSNVERENYKIIEKFCNKTFNRSSSISFQTKQGIYDVEIPNYKICKSYEDSITLIYSKKINHYFLPDSLWKYKRYVYGCIILVIASVLPWIRMKSIVNGTYTR